MRVVAARKVGGWMTCYYCGCLPRWNGMVAGRTDERLGGRPGKDKPSEDTENVVNRGSMAGYSGEFHGLRFLSLT